MEKSISQGYIDIFESEIDTSAFGIPNDTLAFGNSVIAGRIEIIGDNIVLDGGRSFLYTLNDGGLIFWDTLNSSTTSKGNAGDILIRANNLSLINNAVINTTTGSEGNAGNVIIDVETLTINDSSQILTDTSESGRAGFINIKAREFISLPNGGRMSTETNSLGEAGDINIDTPILTIGGNAQLSATATATSTSPTAGDINLNVNQLNIAGKLGIFAETQSIAEAGSLKIQPYQSNPNLNIQFIDDGFISARTTNIGDGGSIGINAPKTVDIRGIGSITVETSGSGKAGSINLTTNELSLSEGVKISASTSPEGSNSAGNIILSAKNINLNQATINAFTEGKGNAGSILIENADNLNVTNNTQISTEIRSKGEANQPANITISSNRFNLNNWTLDKRRPISVFTTIIKREKQGNLSSART